MSPYYFAAFVIGILVASVALTIWCSPRGDAPTVMSPDAIDEEIRRERLELHNAGCEYGERNRGLCQDHTADECHALSVEMMLAAAFRQGAQWQQRRDAR